MRPIALGLIKAYKVTLSPYMPGQCRFSPSCSEYATDAIEAYGVLKGTAMAASRLVRCRPGVEGGYDPAVPDKEFEIMSDETGQEAPVLAPTVDQLK